jgi:4-hydroxy-tetrahydrodipicolinate reductase
MNPIAYLVKGKAMTEPGNAGLASDSAEPIRVGVLGAAGRMGSEVVRAVQAAEGMTVVASLDVSDSLDQLFNSGAQVVVDFTSPAVVMDNIRYCLGHGIHCVVGTSGFTSDRLAQLRDELGDKPTTGVLIAPNFGIAAVLMMKFAEQAARFFDSIEITELHHPNKLDAPSGTARRTAELISQARLAAGSPPMPDATIEEELGARGANINGVRVHSSRIMGMIAHQEIVFGAPGELLTIRHDSMNRESFMPGVVLGVRQVGRHPGLTVGLEHFLDLD